MLKWTRKRPGLYHGRDEQGDIVAVIERGAESDTWWGEIWRGETFATRQPTMREVKSELEGHD